MSVNRQIKSMDASLAIASVSSGGHLVFPSPVDLNRALAMGVFYLEIPEFIDLHCARSFGQELLAADSPYRRIPQYGELEGFIALENNQQTKLALRRHRWSEHYPAEIAEFGRQLDELGIAIIREVLFQSGIPEECWGRSSGGYASGDGTAFLNFVHYDTQNPDFGLRPHTDYGFVTILDATAPGLQIEVDGEFRDVPVLPGHLVINFGEALHFITAHAERTVGAVTHRVLSQKAADPIRHGIVYFANPDLDGLLCQFNSRGEVKGQSSVEDFFGELERRLTEYR